MYVCDMVYMAVWAERDCHAVRKAVGVRRCCDGAHISQPGSRKGVMSVDYVAEITATLRKSD